MNRVKYAELRPDEFLARLAELPLAYLPLGTLEWHGPHLPLGVDAIGSEALMMACAETYGGIVLPPLWLGPDRRMELENGDTLIGMDYAKSTSPHQPLPGSCYWVSYEFFKMMLEQILGQLKRAGFQIVFADGHGPSRRCWTEMIPEWEARFGLTLLGISDEEKEHWGYMIDHAAQNETAVMLHARPDLVNLDVFRQNRDLPLVGVNGIHPLEADALLGRKLAENALGYFGRLLSSKGILPADRNNQ